MYVRLAFSVAAHLEPYILIVDEVLAVGTRVSEKMLERMAKSQEWAADLFVSHNLGLCDRGAVVASAGEWTRDCDDLADGAVALISKASRLPHPPICSNASSAAAPAGCPVALDSRTPARRHEQDEAGHAVQFFFM